MAKRLQVYLSSNIVGELVQTDHGQIVFTYSEMWLNHPDATQISCSLPLQHAPFKGKVCHAFFSGILPEADQRKLIARNLGISANNDFSMLERIGGDCAGALSFLPPGISYSHPRNVHTWLSDKDLAQILRELPNRPLLAGEEGLRLSLAGVQDKIAVCVVDGKIALPLYGTPSTHILKPELNTFEGIVFNEAFCLNLARKMNMVAAKAEVRQIEDIHCLLIERYDREVSSLHETKRLHQEDFCQALGIPAEYKYQNEGGPSLEKCFDLLRQVSAVPVIDIMRLIEGVVFNELIGNCDAHGKNFSLIYKKSSIQLAPFYDLVSTLYYNNLSKNLAMHIGGE